MKRPPVPHNLHETGFAALRYTNGHYWLDSSSDSIDRELTEQKIAETTQWIPGFYDVHPVVNIVRVILTLDPSSL